MRHVYLPTEHSETDLVLAGQVAEMLESDTLYVTWSPLGYRLPDCQAIVHAEEPVAPPAPTYGVLAEALGTMVAFIAALFSPRPTDAR